nr:hypothetical protein Q903MT_gene2098 [Picea sitchensis]
MCTGGQIFLGMNSVISQHCQVKSPPILLLRGEVQKDVKIRASGHKSALWNSQGLKAGRRLG